MIPLTTHNKSQPRWATAPSRRGIYLLALALCVSLLTLYHTDAASVYFPTSSTIRLRSNWYNDEGWMSFDDGTDGLASRWSSLIRNGRGYQCDGEEILADGNTICTSDMTMTKALLENAAAQRSTREGQDVASQEERLLSSASHLEVLGGKHILVLGDSIDRNYITDLAALTSPVSYFLPYEIGDAKYVKRAYVHAGAGALIFPIASNTSGARLGTEIEHTFQLRNPLRKDEFRLDFIFLPGSLGDQGKTGPAFGPIDAESRIREATRQTGTSDGVQGQPGAYDAIYLNLGAWDLAAIQRYNFNTYREDNSAGFRDADIVRYTDRLEAIVGMLKQMFPGSPVIIRLMHDVMSNTVASPGISDDMTGIVRTPTFKLLRVVQMRNAQIAVAKRMSVAIHPFALRMAGRFDYIPDTLHPGTKGNLVYAEMVLRHLAET